MPTLLDDRDKRTVYRRLAKEQFDSLITLAIGEKKGVRLLDEGAIVDAEGNIDCYIEKGTLRKYYDSLPADHEGIVNLGHMQFATFPFILGTWVKKDLHLVDTGGGRQALTVDLHLDKESPFVKELHRADYDVGLSAEFYYSGEWKMVQIAPDEKREVFCINDIFLDNFAIVGECGNVNSSGLKLKGGTEVKDLKKLFLGEEDEAVEEQAETEEATEETEESAEEPEQTEEDDVTEGMEAVLSAVAELKEENDQLRRENLELTQSITSLTKEIKDFVGSFKELTVKVNPNLGEPKEKLVLKKQRDGIGEL